MKRGNAPKQNGTPQDDPIQRAAERAKLQHKAQEREAERWRRVRERVHSLGLGPKLPWRRRP